MSSKSKSSRKLSQAQCEELRVMRERLPKHKVFSFPADRVTVAIRRTGETMGKFSVSIAGDAEKKFRPKVGKYWAIYRMFDGICLPIVLPKKAPGVPDEEILEMAAAAVAESITA